MEVAHLSNLTDDEAVELGTKVGALIGLGIEGEEGMAAGARAGAEAAAEGIEPLADSDAWDVLEDIPNGTAAALLLIEHHWAVPLRDAVASAGGCRIGDGVVGAPTARAPAARRTAQGRKPMAGAARPVDLRDSQPVRRARRRPDRSTPRTARSWG